LAVDQLTYARRAAPGIGWLSWAAYHLLSLETVLVLFLHARHLKLLLPGTPVPETLFYGALSIVVGVWIILHRGIYRRGVPIVIAGLAFTGWMVAAYGWTPEVSLARENLPFILVINLWALFVAACVVAGSRERMLRFLLLMVLLSIALAVFGNYIYLMHGNFRFYRGLGGEWDPRTYLHWGNIIASGAAIALAMILHTRFGSAKNLLLAAILGGCFFFTIVSGARGATLGILAAALCALVVDRPRIQDGRIEIAKAQLVGMILVVILVGYIAYLLMTGQTTGTLGRFLQLFDQADDPLLRRGANRFDYFAGAYRAWLEAPLFGQGLYGFSYFFCGAAGRGGGCYPHNAILHVLADFGLIGLVLFVIFLIAGIRHLGPARLRQDPLMLTLALAFVTVMVNVMVASDTATNYRLFFFIGLLALRPPPPEADDDDEDQGVISQGAENPAPSAIHGAAQAPGRR
jgi:O-antigen ligase